MAENNLWKELIAVSLRLPLHVFELYITEGGTITCPHFLLFFLQPLALALFGLFKLSLHLLFLETK